MVKDTYKYILKKYKLRPGRKYFIEIPNMGRNNLAELFAELGFTKGVELGVERGRYSEILCKANPKLHLYSIDPWSNKGYEPTIHGTPLRQEYYDLIYKKAKKRLAPYNCTIVRKPSKDALNDFKDNSLDFIYIDANHDFPHFTFDLHNWQKKIRMGGIVSGHDYAYFNYKKFNHVKKILEAYTICYRIFPYFVVGSNYESGIRDKFRSWFWVKKQYVRQMG
jgi:hypothetical protein